MPRSQTARSSKKSTSPGAADGENGCHQRERLTGIGLACGAERVAWLLFLVAIPCRAVFGVSARKFQLPVVVKNYSRDAAIARKNVPDDDAFRTGQTELRWIA